MNSYKPWKAGTGVSLSQQEPDRPRHKYFPSSSRHKNSETRATGRERDDARLRSGRGYVSDGPLPLSQSPAPTYPTSAQSLATASKASHNVPIQTSQGYPTYMSQKPPLPNSPLPQETQPTAERYFEPTHDPRATSHRAVAATDKAAFISSDPVRHAEDHHKSSRHRSRHPPTPAPESVEPQTASILPLPSSSLKKVSPGGREREKEQSRTRVREDPKSTSKAKERARAERAPDHVLRDHRERDARYEEERPRDKEERRRERERRREEEQRHDDRRHEQRVADDYAYKATRDQERRHETRDSPVTGTLPGKDARFMRVKDSDDSDNSLMKPQRSIRPKRHHQRDHTPMMVDVPIVLRQPTYTAPPAQAPTAQSENIPASNVNESRRATTPMQSSHATPGASNDRSGTKPQKGSPPQNLTVPYPPGYAVSASDSEHASRREHRSKAVESGRPIERPRTSGGHRASLAHDSVSKPPATQYVQLSLDKNPHKSEKQSKGGFSGWPHREASNTYPRPADAHAASQNATQATPRAITPSPMRNDTSDAVPQVVSIRAGEGPADYLQEFGTRRPTLPTAPPLAKDEVLRQPLPTVQVIRQSQTYDKQPRSVPRTAASVQLDLPGQASITRAASPKPWLQSAQWPTEPQPMTPARGPAVVPSPMVFPVSLASPADIQRHVAPSRSAQHGLSSQQESHPLTQENSRPPAPPTYSHTVPLPPTGSGQRASPQGASPVIHDVVGPKHVRYSSTPVGYAHTQPSHIAPPPARHIAPDLAAVFPIREDNGDAYRQHSSQGERAQDMRPPQDISDQWDRRVVVSTVPSSERTPRSTKASPNLHPRVVNQGTPPKPSLQPIPATTFLPQPPTNPDVQHVHDSSRHAMYSTLNQNSNSTSYPAAFIYPSSSPRTHVEASPAINNHPVANAPPNNPSPKIKPGNPSPRSRSQVVSPLQGPTPPVAAHITTRTPSHDTGSTTLLGQTPSSQGSMSLQLPMSPTAHPQVIASRAATHGGQQSNHASAPVSDSLGVRNALATSHPPATTPRQTSSRHHHSMSAPAASVYSPTQPPPARSQTQPMPRAPGPLSPTPVRSYSTAQTIGDPQAALLSASGYTSTLAPNPRQQRDVIPSPSQGSELNTPSSLAISTKLPIVSDEPIAPVMSSQSLQEPKKKSGFFQGLGLFRSKSSAQKRHPRESKVPDSHAQTATSTRLASSKTPAPVHYESDSKVGTRTSKLRKSKAAAATHTPAAAVAPPPPQPPPPAAVSIPMSATAIEEKFGPAPNAFASIRIVSKRYRTMSGASAEAVDGTNAGASTVLTSPANSTRSPTPKLIPPQRDPQQATYAWRNKEEAEARQRGNARRRRPGVHFEGYEDHPQAEHHRVTYAVRARDKSRN